MRFRLACQQPQKNKVLTRKNIKTFQVPYHATSRLPKRKGKVKSKTMRAQSLLRMPCLLTALLSLSKLSFPAFASEVAYASRGLAPHYLGRALEEDGHEGHDHGGGGGGDEGPQGMAIRMHSEDPQSFQIDAQLTKGDADEIVVMFKLVEEGAESGHEGHDHGRALEEDDHSGHDHDEGPGVDHDHEFDEMKEKITDDDAMDAACTEVKFGKHLELKFEHEDAEDYRPCFHLEISSSVSVSSYGVKVTTEEEGDLLILAMPVEHHHDEGGGGRGPRGGGGGTRGGQAHDKEQEHGSGARTPRKVRGREVHADPRTVHLQEVAAVAGGVPREPRHVRRLDFRRAGAQQDDEE